MKYNYPMSICLYSLLVA